MPAYSYSSQHDGGRASALLSAHAPKAALALLCLLCCLGRVGQAETETQSWSPSAPSVAVDPVEPAFVEPTLPVSDQPQVTTAPESNTTELSPSPRRFHYSLSIGFRAAYDDNVTLSQTDPVDDFYGRVEAIIKLGWGDAEGRQENFLGVNYSPSYYFYGDNSNFNTFEHLARLDALYRFSRLTLSAIVDIQSVLSSHLESQSTSGTTINASNINVGSRRRLTTYHSSFNAAYDLSGKTSLSAGIDYSIYDFSDLISSQTVTATVGLDYKLGPKVGIGLAGSAGKNFVDDPTPDQTFEQINARMTYEITGKVTANASGGVEFRQFDGGTGDRTSPVFQLGLNYQPFDGTTLALNASGQILNSAVFSNQDYFSTQFVASLRQRLFQRVSASISGGYQNLSYFSTVDGTDTVREDNYYFIQPGIDVTITRYWSAGVYYLHRVNDSTITIFGFNENQFGLQSRITF